jgi:hypothetical protein
MQSLSNSCKRGALSSQLAVEVKTVVKLPFSVIHQSREPQRCFDRGNCAVTKKATDNAIKRLRRGFDSDLLIER